jgi:oxygen-independent coproporphyrinogen-3 oxidase
MAAPAFTTTPFAERERPDCEVLRLYTHVPFCNYACSFCFFATKTAATRPQMERYVAALERELEWTTPGTRLSQLFVGGGTPTALPPDLLDRMLQAIFTRLPPDGSGVHTLEASPESLGPDHIRVLNARGIGRVSMGIQSLDDRILNTVHRRHSALQAREACQLLVAGGLILNVDLMYGLPGQTEESFRKDLESIASWGVHSVTAYNLRLNEATVVARALKDSERLELSRLARWRAFVASAAAELGFTQTRWHTFKRLDSIAARHERLPCFDNKKVMGYQLGIGMSARSHLGSTIYRNHKDFNVYLDRIERGQSPVEETFPLRESDRKTQFIARSLGDGKPLNRAEYERAFGCAFEADYGELLARVRDADLVEDLGSSLVLTEMGKLLYDVVTLAFYPAHAHRWLAERSNLKLGMRRSLMA